MNGLNSINGRSQPNEENSREIDLHETPLCDTDEPGQVTRAMQSVSTTIEDLEPELIVALSRTGPRLIELLKAAGKWDLDVTVTTEYGLQFYKEGTDFSNIVLFDDIVITGTTVNKYTKWINNRFNVNDYNIVTPLIDRETIALGSRPYPESGEKATELDVPLYYEEGISRDKRFSFGSETVASLSFLNKPYDIIHPIFERSINPASVTPATTDALSFNNLTTTQQRANDFYRYSVLHLDDKEPWTPSQFADEIFRSDSPNVDISKVRLYEDQQADALTLTPMFLCSYDLNGISWESPEIFTEQFDWCNELLTAAAKKTQNERQGEFMHRVSMYLSGYLYGLAFDHHLAWQDSVLEKGELALHPDDLASPELQYLYGADFAEKMKDLLYKKHDGAVDQIQKIVEGFDSVEASIADQSQTRHSEKQTTDEMLHPSDSKGAESSTDNSKQDQIEEIYRAAHEYISQSDIKRQTISETLGGMYRYIYTDIEIPAAERIRRDGVESAQTIRLETGLTYNQLRRFLTHAYDISNEEKLDKELSLAIDRLVDRGVMVPGFETRGEDKRPVRTYGYGECALQSGDFKRLTSYWIDELYKHITSKKAKNSRYDVRIPKLVFEKIGLLVCDFIGQHIAEPIDDFHSTNKDALARSAWRHGAVGVFDVEGGPGNLSVPGRDHNNELPWKDGYNSFTDKVESLGLIQKINSGNNNHDTIAYNVPSDYPPETWGEAGQKVIDTKEEVRDVAMRLYDLYDELSKKEARGKGRGRLDHLLVLSTVRNNRTLRFTLATHLHLFFEYGGEEEYDSYPKHNFNKILENINNTIDWYLDIAESPRQSVESDDLKKHLPQIGKETFGGETVNKEDTYVKTNIHEFKHKLDLYQYAPEALQEIKDHYHDMEYGKRKDRYLPEEDGSKKRIASLVEVCEDCHGKGPQGYENLSEYYNNLPDAGDAEFLLDFMERHIETKGDSESDDEYISQIPLKRLIIVGQLAVTLVKLTDVAVSAVYYKAKNDSEIVSNKLEELNDAINTWNNSLNRDTIHFPERCNREEIKVPERTCPDEKVDRLQYEDFLGNEATVGSPSDVIIGRLLRNTYKVISERFEELNELYERLEGPVDRPTFLTPYPPQRVAKPPKYLAWFDMKDSTYKRQASRRALFRIDEALEKWADGEPERLWQFGSGDDSAWLGVNSGEGLDSALEEIINQTSEEGVGVRLGVCTKSNPKFPYLEELPKGYRGQIINYAARVAQVDSIMEENEDRDVPLFDIHYTKSAKKCIQNDLSSDSFPLPKAEVNIIETDTEEVSIRGIPAKGFEDDGSEDAGVYKYLVQR